MRVRTQSPRYEKGFIISTEMMMIATLLVIGMTVGLVTLRDAITSEFEDAAEAVGSLDQSYTFQGLAAASGVVTMAGSSFSDSVDVLAGDGTAFSFQTLDATEGGLVLGGVLVGASPGAASSSNAGAFSGAPTQAVQ